jgi:hypothetical protein
VLFSVYWPSPPGIKPIAAADKRHVRSRETAIPPPAVAVQNRRFSQCQPSSRRRSDKEQFMANPSPASGKLLSFPMLKHTSESPLENWIHRLVETKDNLVSALELLRISYNAMHAGKPILEAEKILEQVDGILKHAEKVKGSPTPTATAMDGWSVQPAKQKPLLHFPKI